MVLAFYAIPFLTRPRGLLRRSLFCRPLSRVQQFGKVDAVGEDGALALGGVVVVADPVVLLVVPLPGPAIASVFSRTRPVVSRQCVAAETASLLEPPGPDIPGGFGEPPGGLVCAAAAKAPAMTKQIVISVFDMTHSVGWLWACRKRRTPRSETPAGHGCS
jgi:hypothetical protein